MTRAFARVEIADWPSLADADRDAVRTLRISAAQTEFAGAIERSIAACEAGDASEVAGLAIRADADIVGWVLLKRGAAAPEWVDAGAVVISGLRIDEHRQGRGLGAAALAEIACWVARHWDGASRLVLRVDDSNTAGIRAYEKAGWVESGERRVGRVGVERTMSRPL